MEKIRWAKMAEDTKKFFVSPQSLYQNFEKEGGYLEPLVYIFIIYVLVFILLLPYLFLKAPLAFSLPHLSFSFFVFIFILPIEIFISTAIAHLIWRFLGSKESFKTSFKCMASFAPLTLIGIVAGYIPFLGRWLGGIVYIFIGFYYIVLASVYVHNIDREKATKVFLSIAIVLALINITTNIRFTISNRKMQKQQEEIERKYDEWNRKMEENYKKQMEEYQKNLEKVYPSQPPQENSATEQKNPSDVSKK